jgi:uncharacterized protein YigE (DUF2233 family)
MAYEVRHADLAYGIRFGMSLVLRLFYICLLIFDSGLAFAHQAVELDLKTTDLKLYWKKADGTAFETLTGVRDYLKAQGKTLVMATNSGIYGHDGAPIGLHVERGVVLQKLNKSHASTGNFFMNPNGVFFVNGVKAQILTTEEYALLKNPAPAEAAQSGPLLVRKGQLNPKFHGGSGNKNIRSGVGINGEGHVVFAISDDPVEFYDFAVYFRDTLHCQDALYLDGTISALLTPSQSGGQIVPFVGIWAATK